MHFLGKLINWLKSLFNKQKPISEVQTIKQVFAYKTRNNLKASSPRKLAYQVNITKDLMLNKPNVTITWSTKNDFISAKKIQTSHCQASSELERLRDNK